MLRKYGKIVLLIIYSAVWDNSSLNFYALIWLIRLQNNLFAIMNDLELFFNYINYDIV